MHGIFLYEWCEGNDTDIKVSKYVENIMISPLFHHVCSFYLVLKVVFFVALVVKFYFYFSLFRKQFFFSGRYRIQCEEFYGLWLLVDELIYRLRKRIPDIYITSQDSPALEEYVPMIDEHFQVNMNEFQKKKSNFHYTRYLTPKRGTSDGAPFRR